MCPPRRLFSHEERIQRFARRSVEGPVRAGQAGRASGRRIVARYLEAGRLGCDNQYHYRAAQ